MPRMYGELLTCPGESQCSFLNLFISSFSICHGSGCVGHPWVVCWSTTAPRPCDEASAETLVGAIGLYMAKTQGVAISVLTLPNASSWRCPYDQMCLVLRSSIKGLGSEAICGGINEECW